MCYRNILKPIGDIDQQTMEFKKNVVSRKELKSYKQSNNEEYLDLIRLKLMVYLAGQCVCSDLAV